MLKKLLGISSLFSFIFGVTHYVPDQFSTIQEGINEASEGDTVLVSQGTLWELNSWKRNCFGQ